MPHPKTEFRIRCVICHKSLPANLLPMLTLTSTLNCRTPQAVDHPPHPTGYLYYYHSQSPINHRNKKVIFWKATPDMFKKWENLNMSEEYVYAGYIMQNSSYESKSGILISKPRKCLFYRAPQPVVRGVPK